jgi:Flp pilus assembly protein TadD
MNVPSRLAPYEEGLGLSARGQHALAIERFEEALARAPDDVRVLFALGNTARVLGLAQPAEAFFRRVLAQEPNRLEALINLANLLRVQGNFTAAEALLLPAMTCHHDSPEFWLTLGSIYRETGDRIRAKEHYCKALEHHPNYPPAMGNLADLLADDGYTEDALSLYDRVLQLEKDNAQARLNRAVLHLSHGNLKDGWRDYTARLKIPGKSPIADHKLVRWSGGALKRQRLLITAEQGIGDQLMFASMIPDLIGRAVEADASLILECEPRLAPLFARSFPAVTVRPWDAQTRGGVPKTRYGWLRNVGGATSAIEMGSLPRYLRPTLQSFPLPNTYLIPDPEEVLRWRVAFSDRPAIGICWRSGKMGGHRSLQYAPLEAWGAFVRDWPWAIVSAQYDATPEEIDALQSLSGKTILVPQAIDQKTELDRACALLASLDAVVSAPTAVSWLASATGVPTYKILYDKSWTSFGEAYEPFAPVGMCMTPDTRGDWADSFAKARKALSARFSAA